MSDEPDEPVPDAAMVLDMDLMESASNSNLRRSYQSSSGGSDLRQTSGSDLRQTSGGSDLRQTSGSDLRQTSASDLRPTYSSDWRSGSLRHSTGSVLRQTSNQSASAPGGLDKMDKDAKTPSSSRGSPFIGKQSWERSTWAGAKRAPKPSRMATMLVESLLPPTEQAQELPEDLGTESMQLQPSEQDDLEYEVRAAPRQSSVFGGEVGRRHSRNALPTLCAMGRFRVLDRDGNFGQSRGHWAINNVARGDSVEINQLHISDAYHTFLDAPLWKQLLLFGVAYMLSFLLFAVAYLSISKDCGLGLNGHFVRAYLLSLETMITIGYGVPDPYMQGCVSGPVVLTMQSLLQLLMASLLIGVIFQRLSRPQSRACTILFSQKAVIRDIDGAHYFMFRICDMRIQHALIEPHVRCYALRKHPMRGYEFAPMRLECPDDDLGSALLMNIPYTVVHRIDAWSPLAPSVRYLNKIQNEKRSSQRGSQAFEPAGSLRRQFSDPEKEYDEEIEGEGTFVVRERHLMRTVAWPATPQRQVDCETGNRNSCLCPTCGESFGTASMLRLHCQYNSKADKASGYPPEMCHQMLTEEEAKMFTHEDPTRQMIQEHLEKYLEVVVLVEGIEPTTSSTLQARHSYLIGGPVTYDDFEMDFEWDKDFAHCTKVPRDTSKGLILDLSEFHHLESLDTREEHY